MRIDTSSDSTRTKSRCEPLVESIHDRERTRTRTRKGVEDLEHDPKYLKIASNRIESKRNVT